MEAPFLVVRDERDPSTVRITGRVPRACQAELAGALAREIRSGLSRVDLTGLTALNLAAVEVLAVLAAETDLELVVAAGGPVARKVHALGLDSLATVRDLPVRREPEAWVAQSA